MRISLQWRLLAAFVVVIVVAVVVVAWVGMQNTASEFGSFVARSGQMQHRPLVMMLSQHYAQNQTWADAQNFFGNNMGWMGERIVIVDAQSIVVADSANALLGQTFHPGPLDTATEIRGSAGVIGWLYINPSADSVQLGAYFLQASARGLALAALAAMLVAVGLSFLIARRITAPVRALTTAAEKMAHGDLSQRVTITESDEIGELGGAFNTMASSLAQTDQLRRNLVADVAHELRTPLTSVLGSLEALRDGVAEPTPAFLDSAYEEGLLLKQLVNDLQELSLAEQGQAELDRQQIALAAIVASATRAVAEQAQIKEIAIHATVSPDLRVEVDAARIGQVLRNLLVNALTFTPNHGRVEIDAQPTGEWAQVSVSDSGVGIAAEDLPFVFERFYRADKSRARATGGAGLGLAIAKQWVAAHGGTIWVQSEPQHGTTFTLTLPLAK